MTLFLKNYLKMLNDTGVNNKDNMIMNIGLLLEKNISKDLYPLRQRELISQVKIALTSISVKL